MERERLNHLMQDPSRVAKEDLAGLAELTGRYPWFSAAHLLLAVGEHASGDVLYDERARTAAAHLPVRSVLFDLVHPVPVDASLPEATPYTGWATAPIVEIPAMIAAVPVLELPVVEPPIVEPPVVEPPVVAPPPAPLPAPEMPVAEVPIVEPPVITPLPFVAASLVLEVPEDPWPVPTVVPEAIAPPPPVPEVPAVAPSEPEAVSDETPEADPLDALIRQAAYAGTYELLLDHEIGHAPPPTEAAPEPEAPAEEPMMEAEVPPPAPVVAPRPKSTGRHRFTDWLEQADQVEAAPVVPSTPAPTDWLRTAPVAADPAPEPAPAPIPVPPPAPTPAPIKPSGGMSVLDATSLIDSFIRKEHPEPPKRTEFFNPQTAAKRSLEEHVELVTETLARIYEQQGNTAKAMAAYRKLAERHPERKDHFLGLAKALEGKGKA